VVPAGISAEVLVDLNDLLGRYGAGGDGELQDRHQQRRMSGARDVGFVLSPVLLGLER
jgi:hypothetical protein